MRSSLRDIRSTHVLQGVLHLIYTKTKKFFRSRDFPLEATGI